MTTEKYTQKPVTWRCRKPNQEKWTLFDSPQGWWQCQPLYAAPQDTTEMRLAKIDDLPGKHEPIAWAVWVEVAGMPGWDSLWERSEFANDHLNDMLQKDCGKPITASGIVAMACVENDKYPIPEWLRNHIQTGLKEKESKAAPQDAREAREKALDGLEPTPEMIQAFHDRFIEGADYLAENSIEYALYKEALKAAIRALK